MSVSAKRKGLKILRIGFAMGGGVSLGAYSGSTLTEALKQMILLGQDSSGKPYDDIELDVMSGSSAGAISLAVMLRSLADPIDTFCLLHSEKS